MLEQPINIEKLSALFGRPVDECITCKSRCNLFLKEFPQAGEYPYSECPKCGWHIYLMYREEIVNV